MKTRMFTVKSWLRTGPGGFYCYCCGPAPKHRKLFSRLHKKKTYRYLDKLDLE